MRPPRPAAQRPRDKKRAAEKHAGRAEALPMKSTNPAACAAHSDARRGGRDEKGYGSVCSAGATAPSRTTISSRRRYRVAPLYISAASHPTASSSDQAWYART